MAANDTRQERGVSRGSQIFTPRLRAKLAPALFLLGAALSPWAAHAQYATGGSGAYRNNILWFDWSAAGANIPQAGTSVTNTQIVNGQTLAVSCAISGISGTGGAPDLKVYVPGGFFQDGLDDLYNIGGADLANTMHIGIVNRTAGKNTDFDFACTATLNGAAFPLAGLVLADAETTNQNESIQATFNTTTGAKLRVIERTRSPTCDEPYLAQRQDNGNGTDTYVFQTGPSPTTSQYNCVAATPDRPGAMGVHFIDGATSAHIATRSLIGVEGIALGVMLYVADHGDAPTAYGEATHIIQKTWSGGELTAGAPGADIFDPTFTLATQQPPAVFFGTDVSVENAAFPNAVGASADTFDDGLTTPLPVFGAVGSTYTLTPSCTGNGAAVSGWVDFDFNGSFDAGEIATGTCLGGVATLNWTVPASTAGKTGTTYVRLRIAANSAEVASPVGIAYSGEVEDYAVTVPGAVPPTGAPIPTTSWSLLTLALSAAAGMSLWRRRGSRT